MPPTPPSDGAIFHSGYNGGLYENPTARNVGDVVTVVLEEATTAAKSSSDRHVQHQRRTRPDEIDHSACR